MTKALSTVRRDQIQGLFAEATVLPEMAHNVALSGQSHRQEPKDSPFAQRSFRPGVQTPRPSLALSRCYCIQVVVSTKTLRSR